MPFRDWQLRLQDIIESIDEILEWTANMTFEDFSSNRVTLKAVLYNLGIIGEASRNIPSDIQLRYSQIPWRLIVQLFIFLKNIPIVFNFSKFVFFFFKRV